MTATVLNNCTIHVDGFDFTGHASSINIQADADDQDVTTFGGNGWRQKIGGLRNCEAKADIFWESDDLGTANGVDPEVFNHLGVVNTPATFGPSHTEGDPAYMFQAGQYSYELLGDIGDVSKSTLDMSCSDTQGLVRGQWAKVKGNVSSSGALGSAVNLTAAGTPGTHLYCAFHVFTAGTTLSVKVESDTTSGFSTPADVASATIGPLSARGGTWGFATAKRLDASAFSDTWYRLNVTACTGTFSVAAVLAIQ